MFTPEIWGRLVARYQQDFWPLQLFTLTLGAFLLWLTIYQPAHWHKFVSGGLIAAWLWVGGVFHFQYFATITWAAQGFAILFILQASVLLVFGIATKRALRFDTNHSGLLYKIGVAVVVLAIFVLPAVTALLADDIAQASVFGLSPDATALATIGFILAARPKGRSIALILPVIWILISLAQRWVIANVAGGG